MCKGFYSFLTRILTRKGTFFLWLFLFSFPLVSRASANPETSVASASASAASATPETSVAFGSSEKGFQTLQPPQILQLPPTLPTLLAQVQDDYDPFVDYGEFEEDDDQEKRDMDFFGRGRFLAFSFQGIRRQFTSSMGKHYNKSFSFGLFFSYFFSLNHALQMGYSTGQHVVIIPNSVENWASGVILEQISLNYYYYWDTEKLIKVLGQLKPHVILGLSSWERDFLRDTQAQSFSKDSTSSFNFGLGIELFFNQNKMFLGFQWMYHFIHFVDEGKPIVLGFSLEDESDAEGEEEVQEVDTGIILHGDMMDFSFSIGLNF